MVVVVVQPAPPSQLPYGLGQTYLIRRRISEVGRDEGSADVWFLGRMGVMEY